MMCHISKLTLMLIFTIFIQERCETVNTSEGLQRNRTKASNCEVYQSAKETEFFCERKLRILMPFWYILDKPLLRIFCHSDDLLSNVPDIIFTDAYIHEYVLPMFYDCPVIKQILQKFWPLLEFAPKLNQMYISGYGSKSRVLQLHERELVDFQIDELSIESQPVKKLPGIVFPSTLENLLIANTNITTIPETIFTNTYLLHTLKLEYNNLNHIPKLLFQNLTRLQVLSLAGNQLVDLDQDIFCGLNSLKEVHLNENKFQNLPNKVFSFLLNLSKVNLGGNSFISLNTFFMPTNSDSELLLNSCDQTDVNNQTISTLIYLDISDNVYLNSSSTLVEGRFQGFPKLVNLQMKNCSIENIPTDFLNGSVQLESLDISNNRIEILPQIFLSESPQVEELRLSHNKLSTIPRELFRHKSHKILRFNNNLLQEIHVDTFQNLSELYLLDLSHNNLSTLHVNIFDGTYNLRNLYLNNNKLRNIPNGLLALNKLQDLDLSYNEIKSLGNETFKEAQNLLKLKLNNNGLQNLSNALLNLYNLQVLDLSHNNLLSLETDSFKGIFNVRNIYLSNNGLLNISDVLVPLRKVEIMDLSYNEISSVKYVFFNNSNLRELDLSHNKLESLDKYSGLDGLGSLKILSLASNEINYVESLAFVPAAGLISLNLANNSIEMFISIRNDVDSSGIIYDASGSAQLLSLQYLDLSNNLLLEIPKYFKEDLTNLRYLNLSNNRISEITSYDLQYSSYNMTVDAQRNLVKSINLIFSQLYQGHIESNSSVRLNLNYNPLSCNCDVFHFMKLQDEDIYMYNDERNIAKVVADKLSCSEPNVLEREIVENIADWAPKALSLLAMCLF